LVEWNDPRVVVAIYAAIVATVSLLWHIITFIKNNIRKIKVVVYHRLALSQDRLTGAYYPAVGIIEVKATNYSNEDVYIKDWYIQLSQKINLMKRKTNELKCLDISETVKYPYLLKKGDVLTDITNVRSVTDIISKKIPANSKMKICVYDTFGKKYQSNKFNYKDILALLETENIGREKYMLNITSQ